MVVAGRRADWRSEKLAPLNTGRGVFDNYLHPAVLLDRSVVGFRFVWGPHGPSGSGGVLNFKTRGYKNGACWLSLLGIKE